MARRFLRYIESPLLTRVAVSFSGFDAVDLEPARVPDLFAERPLVITGKYRGPAQGTVRITGFTGQGRFDRTLKVSAVPAAAGEALKYLWARERRSVVSDYASVARSEETRAEITALGLKYGLLTAYTSFVAIDERIRRTDGKVETVKQPLPLPQGVSDLAVGGGAVRVGGFVAGGVAGGVVGGVVGQAPAAQALTSVAESMAAVDAAKQGRVVVPPLPPGGRGTIEVTIVENRLVGAGQVSDARLASIIAGALGGVTQCFAGIAPTQSRNLRVRFDGSGHVNLVQVLEQERWKDAPAFVKCLQDAIRNAVVLPWRAGGEIVIRLTVR